MCTYYIHMCVCVCLKNICVLVEVYVQNTAPTVWLEHKLDAQNASLCQRTLTKAVLAQFHSNIMYL